MALWLTSSAINKRRVGGWAVRIHYNNDISIKSWCTHVHVHSTYIFNDIGTELLYRQNTNVVDELLDDTFRVTSDAQLKHVLYNIVAKRILDQGKRMSGNFLHQLILWDLVSPPSPCSSYLQHTFWAFVAWSKHRCKTQHPCLWEATSMQWSHTAS